MTSPRPKKVDFDFYTALKEMVNGKKISKRSWNNADYFYLGDDSFLKVHKDDGEHTLMVHVADITGTDYFIVTGA